MTIDSRLQLLAPGLGTLDAQRERRIDAALVAANTTVSAEYPVVAATLVEPTLGKKKEFKFRTSFTGAPDVNLSTGTYGGVADTVYARYTMTAPTQAGLRMKFSYVSGDYPVRVYVKNLMNGSAGTEQDDDTLTDWFDLPVLGENVETVSVSDGAGGFTLELDGYAGNLIQTIETSQVVGLDYALPIANYTAARALVELVDGQRIAVYGKNVAYDFARSDWVFDSATVADNGGTILAVTTGGHLRRVYEGPAILDWFEGVESGADLAYASLTDSTAGIQAALDAQLPAYAGVKGRHYKLTASVVSKASASIDGNGCTFKVGQVDFGLASGAIEIDTGHDKSTVKNINFVGEHDMTWFLGNTEWGHGDSCVYVRAATDVTVSGIRITGRHRGIIAEECINPSIDDYTAIGFFPDYDDATYPIANAITNANYVYAVYIDGGEQASISKGRGSHMGSLVLVGDASQGAYVTDIIGEELRDNLVYISSGDHTTVTHTSVKHTVGTGVKMRGSYNVAEHGYSLNAGVGALIGAYGDGGASTGSRISHFTALQPRSRGIYLDPGIGPISDASVTDCTITGALDEALVSLSVDRLTVRNVHSTGALSTDAAFIIYGIDASNLCNLTLDNCSASSGSKRGFLIQHAKGSVTRCSGVGNVNQLIEPRHCDGVSFHNNECKDQICIYMLDAAPNVNCIIGDQIGDPAGVVSTVYTQAANTAANMLTGNSRKLHALSIPGIGAAPKAIGLKAYAGAEVYLSVGTASTADWKQVTGSGTATPEGTAVKSTGVATGWVLQADGDDTASWIELAGGGNAQTANPLSQFATTTSAQLAGVLSDETGTGSVVFSTSPTLITPNLGTPSALVGTNISGIAAGLTVGATTGVEPGADVTDTANVTAAGALMDSEVDANLKTLTLPATTTISTFGASLVDDVDASAARTTLGVDVAGTDNSTDVTLAGTPDYLTLSGQVLTRNAIDLTADVTGVLPIANIATGTPTGSLFVRDDGTLATPPGSAPPAVQFVEHGDTITLPTTSAQAHVIAHTGEYVGTLPTATINGVPNTDYELITLPAAPATDGINLRVTRVGPEIARIDGDFYYWNDEDPSVLTLSDGADMLTQGESLVYTSKNSTWFISEYMGAATTTVASLNDITDVTIADNTSGELLKWDGTAWINQTLIEAGIQAYNAALTGTTGTYTTANATTLGTALQPGGALGTPASGVATNLTGTAAGLTAGNVTTNANLTGHITSSGSNATVLGSFTRAQLNTAISDADVPADYVVPVTVAGTTDTLSAAEHGLTNRYSSATLVTVTIPTNASVPISNGYWIALYAEGAGGITLSTTGITTPGLTKKTIATGQMLVLQKQATDTWIVTGGTAT